jgi:capsular polysaccharide export protein
LALAPRGCRTFYFENGLLPNTTTLDAKGVNFLNSVPRDAAFFRNYASRGPGKERQPPKLVPRKARQTGIAPVELPDAFVFIPFQDDRDSQVRLFSPWVSGMRELFAIGERLHQETGVTVVFKEHPSSPAVYPDLHARTHEQLFFANGNATQELIERCQYVVTLNSTVGIEGLLLGKPVMTLGQAFFNIPGLTVHADDQAAVVDHARRFPEWNLDEQVRLGFLNYMSEAYCVPGRWQDAEPAHLKIVAERLQKGMQ